MANTAERVLRALEPYKLKKTGPDQYRCNSPFRSGSDSQAFTLTISGPEHGGWHDFPAGESGSLYELADRLGIETGRHDVADSKRDSEWSAWSDREIARRCGVSPTTVGTMRSNLSESGVQFGQQRTGADGKTYQASKPERHWTAIPREERHFIEMLQLYGYTLESIIDRIQPGATALTDLTTDKHDTWDKVAELVLEDAKAEFPIGSIVKHPTSRHFGKIMKWNYPRNATVLNMAWGTEQSWTYDSCIMSSFDEWQEWSNQYSRITIASPYSGLQQVVPIVDTPMFSPDESGLLSQTMRTIPAGKSMKFVRAFRQNGNEFAECSWAGSPTYVLLSAIEGLDKHGEYQAPLPDPEENPAKKYYSLPDDDSDDLPDLPQRQIEFLQALAAGQPVNRNAATRFAMRGHGLITDSDDWNSIELTDLGKQWLAANGIEFPQIDNSPTPSFEPGQQVITRTNRTGTIINQVGRYVDVETVNGVQRHYAETLTPVNDQNNSDNRLDLTRYSSEHVQELLPALLMVLDFAEGENVPADGAMMSAAQQLLQFADGVLEMVEAEIYQPDPEEQSA